MNIKPQQASPVFSQQKDDTKLIGPLPYLIYTCRYSPNMVLGVWFYLLNSFLKLPTWSEKGSGIMAANALPATPDFYMPIITIIGNYKRPQAKTVLKSMPYPTPPKKIHIGPKNHNLFAALKKWAEFKWPAAQMRKVLICCFWFDFSCEVRA